MNSSQIKNLPGPEQRERPLDEDDLELLTKNRLNIIHDRLIIPPPLNRIREPISATKWDEIGKIDIDEHGEIFKSMFIYTGGVDFLLDSYNNFIFKDLKNQISAIPLRVDDGTGRGIMGKAYFHNLWLKKPVVVGENGISTPYYPNLARIRGDSYMADMTVDMYLESEGKVIETYKGMRLDSIPIMLGSDVCNLKGLSDVDRHLAGENIQDPMGYFVIKGQERVILIQEKLRLNKILLVPHKPKGEGVKGIGIKATMTVNTHYGGTKVISVHSNQLGELKIRMSFFGQNNFPVLAIYRIFGIQDDKVIVNHILKHTKPQWRKKIFSLLQMSLFELSSIGNVYAKIAELRDNKEQISQTYIDYTRRMVMNDLFPNMNKLPPANKMELLSIMIVRVCEVLAGPSYRELDDRDSWSNKLLDVAGNSLKQLFSAIWSSVIDTVQKSLDSGAVSGLKGIARKFPNTTISKEFISSMSSNNWGVKSTSKGPGKLKQNVTDILKRFNQVSTYAHLRRTNTPANRQTKGTAVRMPHGTQKNIVCIVGVPEGEICGLVKNLSVICYPSIDRDPIPILSTLDKFYVSNKDENNDYVLMYNGMFLGWCNGADVQKFVVASRRSGLYPKDCCVVKNDLDNFVFVHTDAGRPTAPMLIVEDDELVVDKKNLWGKPFDQLLNEGAVEYIDPDEMESLRFVYSKANLESTVRERKQMRVSINNALAKAREENDEKNIALNQGLLVKLNNKMKITHCDIDPAAQLGFGASIIPAPERAQGPRNSYQSNMGQQALSAYSSNSRSRLDTTIKVLAFPSRPIFEPQINDMMGMNSMPAGMMCMAAFMPFLGLNQEDAFVLKKEALERGLFNYIKYQTIKTTAVSSGGEYRELFGIPPNRDKTNKKYRFLTEQGFVKINSEVGPGDCVVAKYRHYPAKNHYEDFSSYLAFDESGTVERVVITKNMAQEIVVKVKLREVRVPIVGDKLASRFAQKGTIAVIKPESELPYNQYGVRPDIIVNSLPTIKRMTMNKYFEVISSKIGVLRGEFINASAHRSFEPEDFQDFLASMGYDPSGKEVLYHQDTGEPLEYPVFMGPCYYQVLRHNVKDKIQARARGPVKPTTRQPYGGRFRRGGLRLGNMERLAILSHGARHVVHERLCISSDAFETVFCKVCGVLAISDAVVTKQIACRNCRSSDPNDFGRTTISYVTKYLINLLNGANINVSFAFSERERAEKEGLVTVDKPVGTDEELFGSLLQTPRVKSILEGDRTVIKGTLQDKGLSIEDIEAMEGEDEEEPERVISRKTTSTEKTISSLAPLSVKKTMVKTKVTSPKKTTVVPKSTVKLTTSVKTPVRAKKKTIKTPISDNEELDELTDLSDEEEENPKPKFNNPPTDAQILGVKTITPEMEKKLERAENELIEATPTLSFTSHRTMVRSPELEGSEEEASDKIDPLERPGSFKTAIMDTELESDEEPELVPVKKTPVTNKKTTATAKVTSPKKTTATAKVTSPKKTTATAKVTSPKKTTATAKVTSPKKTTAKNIAAPKTPVAKGSISEISSPKATNDKVTPTKKTTIAKTIPIKKFTLSDLSGVRTSTSTKK